MTGTSHINWIGVLAILGFLPSCFAALCFAAVRVGRGSFDQKGLMAGFGFAGCVIVAFLFAVAGEYWGGWDVDALLKGLSSSSLKECPAADTNCNPYDTPENRAVFNKKDSASAAAAVTVIFGEVQSHYTTSQVLRWSITNNGTKDLRYYCTVEAKLQNGWHEIDYSIEGDELSREKTTELLPLKIGETKRRNWSLSKDSDRFKHILENSQSKTYRLKAEIYEATGPSAHVIASVFSPQFEVNPAPALKP